MFAFTGMTLQSLLCYFVKKLGTELFMNRHGKGACASSGIVNCNMQTQMFLESEDQPRWSPD